MQMIKLSMYKASQADGGVWAVLFQVDVARCKRWGRFRFLLQGADSIPGEKSPRGADIGRGRMYSMTPARARGLALAKKGADCGEISSDDYYLRFTVQ